ncbi:hypothetical protein ACEV6Q_12595 [Enterobacter ludwigii]|uniref:hypothetical protein n=1 Tax=Enterobacter ludwigii TaxID=299767 RepID=UPI003BEF2397
MKERGMIFNGEMVRAILDGRKTQTRRPVKFPHIDKDAVCELSGNELAGELSAGNYRNSPHGKPGDRIWVRETWAEAGASAPDLKLYRANYPDHVPSHYENVPPADEIRWTPSIHMPRWASRITLEITGVHVERLRDISEQYAQAEGATPATYAITPPDAVYRVGYRHLWESLYGEESWQANPWVWVIEFKRVDGGKQ